MKEGRRRRSSYDTKMNEERVKYWGEKREGNGEGIQERTLIEEKDGGWGGCKRRPWPEREARGQFRGPRLEAGMWAINVLYQPWFIPVGVKTVERVSTMARRQLATEVTDVQAARLLARTGAHPARGSQKREGFLGGQKLFVRNGGRRLVGHGWKWPSSGYLSGPGLLPGPPLPPLCPPSPPRLGVPAAVHLQAERPPLPLECGAALRGCSRTQPSGS